MILMATPLHIEVVTGVTKGIIEVGPNAVSYTYSPNNNYSGNDIFGYRLCDPEACNPAVFTINIVVNPVNDEPTVYPISVQTNEDTNISSNAVYNDIDSDTFTFTVDQPTWGTASINTEGVITYQPLADHNGEVSFQYGVNDGSGFVYSTFSVDIRAVNDAPTASNVVAETLEENTVEILLTANDVDGDSINYQLVGQPFNGSATLSSFGIVTYTPDTNFFGEDTIRYRVNDGKLPSSIATVTVNVLNVDDRPVAHGQSVSGTEDVVVSGQLQHTEYDGENVIYSLLGATQFGVVAVGLDGSFTYTPNLNSYGNDSFTFFVNDGHGDSNIGVVQISIAPVNDPPELHNTFVTTNEDQSVVVDVDVIDVDDNQLNFTIEGMPIAGIAVGGMSLTYFPNDDAFGNDIFAIKAHDSDSSSSIRTVDVHVLPINDAPIALSQTVSMAEDSVYAGMLSGTDIEGSALQYEVLEQPKHGTLTTTLDGNFHYYPNHNYNGQDSIIFVANDGDEESEQASVIFDIYAVNDAPYGSSFTATINEDEGLLGTILGFGDVDGSESFVELVTEPTKGVLTINKNGAYLYQADANIHGVDFFTFKITDEAGAQSSLKTATINILPVNDPPTSMDSVLVTNEDTPNVKTVLGIDLDGDEVTVILSGSPNKW